MELAKVFKLARSVVRMASSCFPVAELAFQHLPPPFSFSTSTTKRSLRLKGLIELTAACSATGRDDIPFSATDLTGWELMLKRIVKP